jgi:Bacterial Ig-like domain (group 2)
MPSNFLHVLAKFRLHIALYFCVLSVLLATFAFGQQPQVLLSETRVESSVDSNAAGTAEAFPVQAVATGQVSSLSLYLDSSNRASTVKVGVYASSNGHPQALLSSGVIANAVAGQWNSVAMPPLQLTSGTTYWLALLGVDDEVSFRDRTGNCQSEVGRLTNLTSLPSTWTTGSRWPTCIVSMFESGNATSGSVPSSASAGISISPHTISLQTGQKQQFAAAVTGSSDPAITWAASGGAINSAGLYTAPATAGTYIVTANAAPSRRGRRSAVTPGSAVVTVTASSPPPITSNIQVSVSPTAASLQTGAQQQFSASVSGTSNTAVTWSVSSGSIAANGMYTAPANAGTYTITAISNSDSTKSGSALVVVSAPQPVAVSISPGSASVDEATQVQFTAAVSGLSNTAVTWAVTRGTGTITQSGLFTAPRAAESDMVTATSQGNTANSASASIVVLPPHAVSLNWSASASTVVFYKVYRGTVSGGPYSLLSANVTTTTYTDSTVQPATTYYYVTSAVDAAGTESIFSNEFQSIIP